MSEGSVNATIFSAYEGQTQLEYHPSLAFLLLPAWITDEMSRGVAATYL